VEPASTPRTLVQKKTLRDSLPIDMLLSACLSWLLRSRVRKFRRDLWITLYLCILFSPLVQIINSIICYKPQKIVYMPWCHFQKLSTCMTIKNVCKYVILHEWLSNMKFIWHCNVKTQDIFDESYLHKFSTCIHQHVIVNSTSLAVT